MSVSVESLWAMPDVQLVTTYHEIRRQYVEKKFARDTQRARLEWLRAKAFAATSGGVTERRNTVEVSEELARKGQELREMTRDLDLLKADFDLVAMLVRMRGTAAPADSKSDDESEDKSDSSQN